MCVNIINGETNNHTIQEKEQPKNKRIFAMDNSAVILGSIVIKADSENQHLQAEFFL